MLFLPTRFCEGNRRLGLARRLSRSIQSRGPCRCR